MHTHTHSSDNTFTIPIVYSNRWYIYIYVLKTKVLLTLHEAIQPNWSLHHPLILPLRGRSLLSQRSREHFMRPAKVCPILDTMPFFWSSQLFPESTTTSHLAMACYGDLNMTQLTSKIPYDSTSSPSRWQNNNELSKWPILILDTNKAKNHCTKQTPICHIYYGYLRYFGNSYIYWIYWYTYIYMWLYMVVS